MALAQKLVQRTDVRLQATLCKKSLPVKFKPKTRRRQNGKLRGEEGVVIPPVEQFSVAMNNVGNVVNQVAQVVPVGSALSTGALDICRNVKQSSFTRKIRKFCPLTSDHARVAKYRRPRYVAEKKHFSTQVCTQLYVCIIYYLPKLDF